MQTKSTLKTTGFFVPWERSLKKLQLWKTQTVCNFTDKALAQYEERSGKKGIATRKLKDGKLVVECSVSNVAILSSMKKQKKSPVWWLTPVILATWEAEIQRIMVPGQPGLKKSLLDAISMEKKVGMVVCTCHPRKGVRKHKTGG
jgi:hypothetical protein